MRTFFVWILFLGLMFSFPVPLFAKESKAPATHTPGTVRCTMDFQLKSWSVFYKSGKGDGTITCSNKQKAKVEISSHGGGITFGKSNIANGKGTFSPVHNIEELYGKYARVGGEGAAVKAGMRATLSKDDITLDIKGTGTGGGFGFDFSGFRISPLKAK